LVGIGASAGGLAALRRFFQLIPEDSGITFVVVIHLSPEHESRFAEVLQPHVKMPVSQVTETVELQPNHVFVIPPGRNLTAVDSHLRLDQLEEKRLERAPIDHFFRTLAGTHDGESVGVILSGTGSDGTLGLKEIKGRGGVVIVQDPAEAEYDGMPQSAVATGLVDLILPLEQIATKVLALAGCRHRFQLPDPDEELSVEQRQWLQKIFALVRSRTGRDFTRYKRSTIQRRVSRRMQLHQIESPEAYLAFVRDSADELHALADDFLITVTNFFRDAVVFDHLEQKVIPELFNGKTTDDEVRVWTVGCATGEEAYSLAILLSEAAARTDAPPRIQVFASDLHEPSLARARDGFYPGDISTDVSEERLKRFFRREEGGYRVRKEIRELVVFAPHNLMNDPPFSRLSLISCRNLLIYLQRDVQREVAELFHYSLQPDGFLLLGSSETLDAAELFRSEHKKHCIYRKRNVPAPEPRLPVFPLTQSRLLAEGASKSGEDGPVAYGKLHARMVERYAPPSLLVAPDDKVVHLSERVGRYLVHPGGELTSSIFKLLREELRVEVRGLLHGARETMRPTYSKPIKMQLDGKPASVVVSVRPASDSQQDGFVLVIFDERDDDAGYGGLLHTADGASAADTRSAELENELHMMRQRLQSIIEEYETGQEEMKASNEELQSTNEELRSTMEELETSKEELQSMNEELQTVNQENRHKVEELAQLSSDLQNLLAATHIATLFLDRDLRILRFTPAVNELFNVRMTDRGRRLADFTHRLGYDDLIGDAESVLQKLIPIEREVRDEDGRWYMTRILPYRSTDERIEGVVITFVDVTKRKQSEEELRQSQQRYRLLVENATEYAIFMLDVEGRITLWNRGAQRLYGYSEDEILGQPASMLCVDEDRKVGRLRRELRQALAEGHWASENWQQRQDGSRFWGGGVITAVDDDLGKHCGFVVVLRDNTERVRAESLIRESEARLRLACESTGFGSYDHDLSRDKVVWSPELYRILQLDQNTPVHAQTLSELVHPDDRESFQQTYRQSLDPACGGQHDHRFRIRIEQQVRWIRDIGHTFFAGPEGQRQAVRIVGMIQDVTAQKEYEASLEQAKSAAEVANRSRGEFLAIMSHEIRTPMTAILGYVDLLDKAIDHPEHRQHLATIHRNGRFLLSILNDILDLSKIDAGKLRTRVEPISLVELLSDVRSLVRPRADEKKLQLEFQFDGLIPETIHLDSLRVRQILLNLLGNAIKFTQGGSVTLVTRHLPEQDQIQFQVIDTGIGIEQEVIDALFQPFSQADNSTTRDYGGSGLGLTICRRLAQMFGGDVELQSQPGQGSTFTVSIDCGDTSQTELIEPKLAESAEELSTASQTRLNATVLLVDDSRDIRLLAKRFLESAGAEVREAVNGREGVAIIQSVLDGKGKIDAVLMDMQMPEMDGYQATRQIRQIGFTGPVVALTAHAMEGDGQACIDAGCTGYFTKPIDRNELIRNLKQLLS